MLVCCKSTAPPQSYTLSLHDALPISAADVASRTATLFTCLPNDEIVRTAYLGADGVASGGARGLVTCDCSTVSPGVRDRKSTRLNSSHRCISYAVFCLKKKKNTQEVD